MKNPEVFIIIKLLRNFAVGMEVGYYFFSFFLILDMLYSRVATLQMPKIDQFANTIYFFNNYQKSIDRWRFT